MKSGFKPFGIIQLAGLTTAMLTVLIMLPQFSIPTSAARVDESAAPQIYGGDVRRAIDACQAEARRRIESEQGYRGQRVNFNFDRPRANAASAAKVDVNGSGRFSVGSAQSQTFEYNCNYSAQRNTINQFNYRVTGGGGGNRPGYYPPANTYPPQGGSIREGRFSLQLVATGRVLDAGNGGQVVQTAQRNTRSQEWDIRNAGNGLYRIVNAQTGQAMGVNGPLRSGVTVTAGGYGSRDILWRIEPGPDGGFYFTTDNNLALDSPSSARFDGGRMQLYRSNREANQRFRMNESYGGGGYRPGDSGNRPGEGGYRPGGGGNRPSQGSMTWSGRVDDEIFLDIRGRSVNERRVSGQPTYNVNYRFSSPMPRNQVSVEVRKLRGRGTVQVVEQPSYQNNFTAVIRIRDGSGGADNYEIEVNWN